MNRRTFLAASAAAAATGLFARRAKAQTPSPNAKLCHACIGLRAHHSRVDFRNLYIKEIK